MSEQDGGPAFPTFVDQYDYGLQEKRPTTVDPGMTLRDYFAAKALQQAVRDEEACPSTFIAGKYTPTVEGIARRAYGYADALLKARLS